MNQNLSEQVEIICHSDDRYSADEVRKYEEALKMFKELQAKGLLKPRGNQLMSLEERMRPKNDFNKPRSHVAANSFSRVSSPPSIN
ncbi:MAG: hypothetical protein ACR2PY_06750 [Salinispira sp.]